MYLLTALIAGWLFGIGLILSGMTDPGKVIAFLDITGHWDPSLAFVMGGAIFVGFFAFRFARNRSSSLLGSTMHLPTATKIDRPLIIGSALFGIGWGLGGFCPGPAIVSLGTGQIHAVIFIVAMLVGMVLFEFKTQ